ncbi:hypothetical protein QDQ23_15860, partial [Citrobacter freundii]
NRMLLILLNKTGYCMRLSRMIDHIKPLFRPKSDQQFSHSLRSKPTFSSPFYFFDKTDVCIEPSFMKAQY